MNIHLKRARLAAPLKLGFLPENDCAPAVVASEFGFFERHGVRVELQRESSCVGLRDRLVAGELHAAIGPATLPYVLSLGLDFAQCPCVSGLTVSSQGNALTISRRLWNQGVRSGAALRDRVFKDWGRHTFTFGVVFPYAPSYFLLTQWLRAARLTPHAHVRIVVMPPEQMFPTLQLGYLDGFCVGEPWSTMVVEAGQGVCLITGEQLAPRHPEKALIVQSAFAQRHEEEHERLIAVLYEAARFCEKVSNADLLCRVLARPGYVNAPAECIRTGLFGPFHSTTPRAHEERGLTQFGGSAANEPTPERAGWITSRLWDYLHLSRADARIAQRSQSIFRPDIFRQAMRRVRRETGGKPVPRELAQLAA